MNIAIIPAGGQGRRMASKAAGTPAKQFLLLGGVPLIIHTLRQFQACPDFDGVLPVLPAAEIAAGTFPRLSEQYQLTKMLPPVAGGAERQASIFAGLTALAASPLHDKTEIVAIHDG